MGNSWFEVDKVGFRKIGERQVQVRGFGILGSELYQNVSDTNATKCQMSINLIEGRRAAEIICCDDGPGFEDITHAWTLFAPSMKKSDPKLAGRFNLGEKVFLSFCREATISTTSGTVIFSREFGRRLNLHRKLSQGTEIRAIVDCTKSRYDEFVLHMKKIIVRNGLLFTLNQEQSGLMGNDDMPRIPIHEFEVKLPTEIGDILSPTIRNTVVEVYEVAEDETPMLYELGVPVVETENKWHINVMQKVPLNSDRDNVTPSYIRKVQVAVINEMHDFLEKDDTTSLWVREVTSDPNCTPEAMKTFLDKCFGKKCCSIDPSNPDANAAAQTSGYAIVPSRGLSPGQRANAKTYGLLGSSSAAFPRVGKGAYSNDPDATPVQVVLREKWTSGMYDIERWVRFIAKHILDTKIDVRVVMCKHFVGRRWAMCYGDNTLDMNLWVLGKKWFNGGITPNKTKILIHELSHHRVSNHATDDFHEECCRIGAELTHLALIHRERFKSDEGQYILLKD